MMVLTALQASKIIVLLLIFAVLLLFVWGRTPFNKTKRLLFYLGVVWVALLAATIIATDTWVADVI